MSIFPQSTLLSAWTKRSTELRANDLQPHNDYLYEVVKSDILARREELHQNLLSAISTSNTPRDLCIPLWNYCTCNYDDPDLFSRTEKMIKQRGYEWYVGVILADSDPERCEPEDWDDLWRWKLPKRVHSVVRHTDFLQRIALLFGNTNFWVSYRPVSRKEIRNPTCLTVTKMELVLHYYPKGVYGKAYEDLRKADVKYATYASESLNPIILKPSVWKGSVEKEPGFSNRTPPPHPVLDTPPPLAARSTAGGIGQEDMDEVARQLSFDRMPCACGYHHDEDEEED